MQIYKWRKTKDAKPLLWIVTATSVGLHYRRYIGQELM